METPWIEIIPYSLNKDYGAAANRIIEHLPEDIWIICSDIDGFIITPAEYYGSIIQDAITTHPDTGLFTCWSQRTRNDKQAYEGLIDENGDMLKHRKTAIQLLDTDQEPYTELNKPISGFWMLFKKETWEQVGGFHEDGCLRVDNFFSGAILKHGMKIRRINSLLYCHYYRLKEGIHQTKHLQ